MRNYTASPRVFDRAPLARRLVLGAFMTLLAGACAQPDTQPSSSTLSPKWVRHGASRGTTEASTAQAPAEPVAAVSTSPAPAASDDVIQPVSDIDQASAAATDMTLSTSAPMQYTVKPGDTLWGIANHFLEDPWEWPQLWYTNSQVRNPHLIYPGETLTLVMVNGHTRLATLDTARLHPRMREESLADAIPAIPLDAIREFLHGPRLVTRDEAQHSPYVIAFTDEHVIAGQNSGIFVKGLPANPGSQWQVVRIGDAYSDPDTGEVLGYEAQPDGDAELSEPGPPASMMLTRSDEEVIIGDRLLPMEAEVLKSDFYPHPPAAKIEGRIISEYGGIGQIAQYEIVAINRGSREGLDPGTVLSIYQLGGKVSDPYASGKIKLPDQKAGVLMVFKVTPRVSYGLVMSSTRTIHVLDKVRNPVSRSAQH